MTTNLLTTKQAAALLHITPNLLRQWVHRKKITAMYPGLFDPDEIERITFQINHKESVK